MVCLLLAWFHLTAKLSTIYRPRCQCQTGKDSLYNYFSFFLLCIHIYSVSFPYSNPERQHGLQLFSLGLLICNNWMTGLIQMLTESVVADLLSPSQPQRKEGWRGRQIIKGQTTWKCHQNSFEWVSEESKSYSPQLWWHSDTMADPITGRHRACYSQ